MIFHLRSIIRRRGSNTYLQHMKRLLIIALGILIIGACTQSNSDENPTETNPSIKPIPQSQLYLEQAEQLVELPLTCIDTRYPNKLNQVIGSDADLASPDALHPAFYGCFDWHSAVHGHWSLVKLVKMFPNLEQADEIIDGLLSHISKENIEGEMKYFDGALSKNFERTYGWAWLLKLADEIHSWDHPKARILEENLSPLTELIAERCIEFLPKLHYPIRVGTHTNTAFAMCMVFDYAVSFDNDELKQVVEKRARDFFEKDVDGPMKWEPSGYDFLSPCLEEANIMRRVLSKDKFLEWLSKFLPELKSKDYTLEPGIVADRSDGHLVHLDGLNFSRAWCLFGIAETLPGEYSHLVAIGNEHIDHSFPNLVGDSYEGGHWLASFALLALSQD
ncbi:MAG: hypothetical protein ACI865_001080 [Flavobacteriaceae bacterium]